MSRRWLVLIALGAVCLAGCNQGASSDAGAGAGASAAPAGAAASGPGGAPGRPAAIGTRATPTGPIEK